MRWERKERILKERIIKNEDCETRMLGGVGSVLSKDRFCT